MIISILKNEAALKECRDGGQFGYDIDLIILDSFFEQLREIEVILKPIVVEVGKSERDDSSIAEVFPNYEKVRTQIESKLNIFDQSTRDK